MQVGAKIAIY